MLFGFRKRFKENWKKRPGGHRVNEDMWYGAYEYVRVYGKHFYPKKFNHTGELMFKTLNIRTQFNPQSWLGAKILSRYNFNKYEIVENENITENKFLKPRKHPGIVNKSVDLPLEIRQTLDKLCGDFPQKAILKDGKKLNQYMYSRHAPIEDAKKRDMLSSLQQNRNELSHRNLNKLLSERIYAWKPLNFGKYEAIVYAIARGAKEYAILTSVLTEIKSRDPNFQPKNFLDFGSGVGTGMWAVSNLWKHSISEYFNVDSSREMNNLSEHIMNNANADSKHIFKNVYYRQFLPALNTKYDLVLSSFTLFEIPGEKARIELLLNLWEKCNGYLILIEEGSRCGSELINEARNLLLNLDNEKPKGHVLAPCPHDLICPRFTEPKDNSPCNFEISYFPLSLCGKNKSSARYSYIVIKKGPIIDLTRHWPRLVRATLRRSGHTICRMCTANAELKELIFTKSKNGKYSYRCAKASRWGDRLPFIEVEPSKTP